MADEDDEELDSDPVPDPVRVWGCAHCKGIFRLDTFYMPENVSYSPVCPRCAEPIKTLGWMPYYVETPEGIRFIDSTGRTSGPYESAEKSREHLWDWFNKEEEHGDTKSIIGRKGTVIQKGCFKLVSSEGILLQEDDQEDSSVHQKGWEAGAEEEADEEAGCSCSSRGCDKGDGGGVC
jgi:hypothetical protein